MQRQNLQNVCSIMHVSALSSVYDRRLVGEDAKAIIKEWRQALFDVAEKDWRHQLLVVGPNQEVAQKSLRAMRKEYPKRLKLLASINTGHGGKTEMWMVLRRFRKSEPDEAFLPDNK